MSEPWWPYYQIRFTKAQMWWLIEHLNEIKNGDWPIKPGTYVPKPKMECKEAKQEGYSGACIACPFIPCLSPGQRTPMRVRKERSINRVLEIAAEVECRLGLVMNYMSGWQRQGRKLIRNGKRWKFKKV